MEIVMQMVGRIWRYALTLRLSDCLDMVIMAVLFYYLLTLMRSAKVKSLLKGLGIFLLALWLSSVCELRGLYYVLSHLVEWGVLALIILFQPEIRRLLEEVGSRRLKFFNIFAHAAPVTAIEHTIAQTVLACAEMSKSKTGVLIVFERQSKLDDIVRSGTVLNATVSSELLKNIFFVKAPMHDGAVIIRDGQLLSAGCMLPLSKNVNLSRDLGMRHRAGIGMSENSDAVVVIVSEETGSISVAIGGLLKRHLVPETLDKLLRNELVPQPTDENEDEEKTGLFAFLKGHAAGGSDDE